MMTIDKIYTTLAQIRACRPCKSRYQRLCKKLGGIKKYGENTPVTFRQIYESNGCDDTFWCLRAVDERWYPLWRHFACDIAQSVAHLNPDPRVQNCIDVARKYADGQATEEELKLAADAAYHAARAAYRAGYYVTGAAYYAACAAYYAARAVDDDNSSYNVARASQIELLFEYCRTGERVPYEKQQMEK